jgi:predicted dinucleotide-binding enzyme
MSANQSLPADLLKGKVVVDTMNYYPFRDGRLPVLDSAELTSSELVARHLAGAKVVKAFHTQDARTCLSMRTCSKKRAAPLFRSPATTRTQSKP